MLCAAAGAAITLLMVSNVSSALAKRANLFIAAA